MKITQRQEYHRESFVGYFPVLQQIAALLCSKVTLFERTKKNDTEKGYQVKTDTKESKGLLIAYLTRFPLFSYKRHAVVGFNRMHELVLCQNYKSTASAIELQSLKESMSSDNNSFTWDHLEDLAL
jgi:hypothetical protein